MEKSFLFSKISPDEIYVWQGKPQKKAFFFKAVFNLLLPFSILWLAFDSTFILSIFNGEDAGTEGFFLIPFFLLHLMPVWIYLGNILFAYRRYQNTEYLLTDKNLYVSGGIFSKEVKIKSLSRLSDLQTKVGLVEKACHVGSILIGDENDRFDSNGNRKVTSVECIADYEELLKRIQSLQFSAASDFSYPNELR